jgi:hypothetical protein
MILFACEARKGWSRVAGDSGDGVGGRLRHALVCEERVPASTALAGDAGEHRSLWHDLPLFELDAAGKPTGALKFVRELPKWTRKQVSCDKALRALSVVQMSRRRSGRCVRDSPVWRELFYGCC